MKSTLYILILFLFHYTYSQQNYLKTWATYYGDESVVIKDSEIDSEGNIYIVGKVQQNSLRQYNVATSGAHQSQFGGGESDGFITKFSSEGIVIWSTYYGGEYVDKIDDISIDKYDNIFCIGGTNSNQNIATINSFQTSLSGNSDAFLVKLNPNGEVLWNSYFGGVGNEAGTNSIDLNENYSTKGIVNDEEGYFYIFIETDSPNMSTAGVFQEIRNDANNLIAKFSDTGVRIWSTYYGINSSSIRSIDLGQTGIFVSGLSIDCPPLQPNTYFATADCHQSIQGSCSDTFLSKFDFNGQRVWSSYYGGTAAEKQNSNSLKCDNGFVYMCGLTSSNNNITTPYSFQPIKISTTYTNYLVKFNENGGRIWGTYAGDNYTPTGGPIPGASKIKINDNGIYIYGATFLVDNISTSNSYQPNMNSANDGFIIKFNSEGERSWGSYFGSSNHDEIKNVLFSNESFYLVGKTESQTGIITCLLYTSPSPRD